MILQTPIDICWVCGRPLNEGTCTTDEHGNHVHPPCYTLILELEGQSRRAASVCKEQNALIDEIASLQRQQLDSRNEAKRCNWTPAESRLAFDKRFIRIGMLVHQLAEIDEHGER